VRIAAVVNAAALALELPALATAAVS